MTDGLRLLARIIEDDDYEAFQRIRYEKLLPGTERAFYGAIQWFCQRESTLPCENYLLHHMEDRLPDAPESLEYYMERVHNRLPGFFSTGLVGRLLHRNSTHAALTGVTTGWPSFDVETSGYQKGTFAIWAGETGIGKTQLLLYQAYQAWKSGKKVLIITTEMSREDIQLRLLGLVARIDYRRITDGQLSEKESERLSRMGPKLENARRLLIEGRENNRFVSNISSLIFRHKPDCVYIDGVYNLYPAIQVGDRYQEVTRVADDVLAIALDRNVPVVATTQMNADGSVAYTKQLERNASLVLKITVGELSYGGETRTVNITKGRTGERGRLQVSFRFSPVHFGEVPCIDDTTNDLVRRHAVLNEDLILLDEQELANAS